ncbi:MAG: glycosyltransferase [Ilumatobacter fluminis]|uniref:glycosyltransferase n=1 Tax=Ilumatobacter fluminis TaxID=467091 RepID=UPI0032EF737B
MSPTEQPVSVLVVVPGPAAVQPAEAMVRAVATAHPSWHVLRVWAGDPELAPATIEWCDAGPTEFEVAALPADGRVLAAACDAVGRLHVGPVVVLTAGAVAVDGSLDALVAPVGEIVVVPRLLEPPPLDDLAPSTSRLADDGRCSTAALGFGAGTGDTAAWLRETLTRPEAVSAGAALETAAALFPSSWCDDPAIGASAWRWSADSPSLLEAPTFDPKRPWLLDPSLDAPPRVSLAGPARRRVVDALAPQLGGADAVLRLPGGLTADETVRETLRRFGQPTLRPWTEPASTRGVLDEHFWDVLHDLEPDLRAAFPDPNGADAGQWAAWTRQAVSDRRVPLLIEPLQSAERNGPRRTADRTDGVNLVGYFRRQSGVGEVARRVAAVLERAGVPHTTVGYDDGDGPGVADAPECDDRLEYANSIVFVNGDQFDRFRRSMPDVFGPGRRVVGVWFWEIDTVDPDRVGHTHVDEIWSATTFMARTFAALQGPEVVHVALPMADPTPSTRSRAEFAPLASAGDRFVFGVVFDHLSVTHRKNPSAAVRAFRDAFSPDEGPLLVVKSINGRRCWQEHERLLAEVGDRPDIIVWDEHLPHDDHMALIGSFDALVSLHRSEGLGLHLAEAMALGVPVIATRYGGNVDLMDDESSILIDAEIVPIGPNGGWAYPATASWAEPDHHQAVAALRRLANDPAGAVELGERGRRHHAELARTTMSEAAFVDVIRHRLGLTGSPTTDH